MLTKFTTQTGLAFFINNNGQILMTLREVARLCDKLETESTIRARAKKLGIQPEARYVCGREHKLLSTQEIYQLLDYYYPRPIDLYEYFGKLISFESFAVYNSLISVRREVAKAHN